MTSTYEYQKRSCRFCSPPRPGTWSMKMPSHSVHIDTLLKVFPDARLVWAHRDPYKATGSLCNLWMLPQGMVMSQGRHRPGRMGRNAMKQMQPTSTTAAGARTHRRRPVLPHVLRTR